MSKSHKAIAIVALGKALWSGEEDRYRRPQHQIRAGVGRTANCRTDWYRAVTMSTGRNLILAIRYRLTVQIRIKVVNGGCNRDAKDFLHGAFNNNGYDCCDFDTNKPWDTL